MSKHTVGVFHKDNYNWHRNITQHDHEYFEFRRFFDYCRVANGILRRVGRWSSFYEHARMPPSYPHVDLYHHWAAVDFGSTPWIVSTSVGLPFGCASSEYRKGLELLASDVCKRILVTGQCAREWQRAKARREPDLEDAVMDKVEVLPPAQDQLVTSWNEKPVAENGTLKLAFVGGLFFLKGGLDMLRVVARLIDEGADLELEIVSSFAMTQQTGDTEEGAREAREIIASYPQIKAHGKLPNTEVVEVFKRSHIGLLPSYIETYGYSVLEAQACGCATITTDIKAFPDTNPDTVGWRVEIDGGDYDFRSNEGRKLISSRIDAGLYDILSTVINDRQVVREKGESALRRIAEEHDPTRHAARLSELYRSLV